MICELCGRDVECARHHCFFGTANRKQSEKWGMVAWLCPECHQTAPWAVHRHRATDLKLKIRYQRIFEAKYSRALFMQIFGRNYLDD